jgi:hypothetical protein
MRPARAAAPEPGPLSLPAYRVYWLSRLAATLAAQIPVVAVGWQIYEVTRRPLDLGLIGLSQFLPFVLLILPAGHVADNHDRRRIRHRSRQMGIEGDDDELQRRQVLTGHSAPWPRKASRW